jgi:hypothetical protein
MKSMVRIKVLLVINYIEVLFREVHCLVTALLLPAKQNVAAYRSRIEGRLRIVLDSHPEHEGRKS